MSLINLLVALPAEAKPIASRLDLERVQPDLGFPLFRRGQISLIVTGPGKINAAAGAAFLGALERCPREAVWVNLGVAGHAGRRIGDVLLASSITDEGSGRVWYPILGQDRPCRADDLLTLDRPDLIYQREGMVDMEASGFFATACRWSSAELVQVLKVVSDNSRSTAKGLTAKLARSLIGDALETLETLLAGLEVRAKLLRETGDRRNDG
ncbi:MAG: hypothetical protein LJE70_14025 [Chromatiaceae bacterium]|nr:hypothetical protein [Chromatiaceae bacterium]